MRVGPSLLRIAEVAQTHIDEYNSDVAAQVIRNVHSWSNDHCPLVFHAVPMIHIGSKAYYDRINEFADVLKNPKNHYAFKHSEKQPFALLTENYRDRAIHENLTRFTEENRSREYRFDIGILFGDAHMPYVYEILPAEGFTWSLSEQIDVL